MPPLDSAGPSAARGAWPRTVIGAERLVLLPVGLAALVQLEQREQRHRDGHAVGAAATASSNENARRARSRPRSSASRSATETRGIAMWREVERRRLRSSAAERRAEHPRGRRPRSASRSDARRSARRQRRRAEAGTPCSRRAARAQAAAGAAEAARLEHPLQQLLGGLGGLQLVAAPRSSRGQHQPRLQLQQRRDQHQELGRRLEVELARGLQVVEVGEHDLGQLHLQQVDLLAQDQRQQEVERARRRRRGPARAGARSMVTARDG